MTWRGSNSVYPKNRVRPYYTNNPVYPGSYGQTDTATRVSHRMHDGFNISQNYGLDTTSDDINESPFSSPYYVNGRYNSDNLVTQRGNSASVQGTKFLLDTKTTTNDFSDGDIQTWLEIWQGKQIKFELPYSGKIIGHTLTLQNVGGCTGILSIYMSASDGGKILSETSIDLCKVSTDKPEHFTLRTMTPIKADANPRKKIYVRMEIWDEVEMERSDNPFNSGKKVLIAATGLDNHYATVQEITDKNSPAEMSLDYERLPSRPLIGLLYNDYVSVPVDRISNEKTGATVSDRGYRYDLFCIKDSTHAEMLIYDKEMNRFINNTIKVDSRVENLNVAQVVDTNQNNWVYYVDGYSALQRFKIGEWVSSAFPAGVSAEDITVSIDDATWYNSPLGGESGLYTFKYTNNNWTYNGQNVSLSTYGITLNGTPAEGSKITVSYTVTSGGTKTVNSITYVDARPVEAASLIMHHNNRLYLTGFRNDRNLVQISEIDAEGPNYTMFPYRFYSPNISPYASTLNPITAIIEETSDTIMIVGRDFHSLYKSNVNIEDGTPQQVSSHMDAAGVESQGDILNYKGVLYSFNQKEGLRRYNGSLWHKLQVESVDSLFDRVDMTKPRKLWGYKNKIHFNYTDKIDHKPKCLVYDLAMNYQQYPWFQDVDIPFCDVRFDATEELVGIHPDYPCVMRLYCPDVWSRLDTPIVFRRDTKFLSMPGNAADMIVKRIHVKVLSNANRWWYLSFLTDKDELSQYRGNDVWWRKPVWDTIRVDEPVENPFAFEDIYEEDSIFRLEMTHLRARCSAIQVRAMVKTFRAQASLISVLLEVQARQYN